MHNHVSIEEEPRKTLTTRQSLGCIEMFGLDGVWFGLVWLLDANWHISRQLLPPACPPFPSPPYYRTHCQYFTVLRPKLLASISQGFDLHFLPVLCCAVSSAKYYICIWHSVVDQHLNFYSYRIFAGTNLPFVAFHICQNKDICPYL